jgi:hypothetical protein
MNTTHHSGVSSDDTAPRRPRLLPLTILFAGGAVLALLATSVAFASGPQETAPAAHGDGHATSKVRHTAAQVAFHDEMRRLWEDHVTWTRLAIVTFAADSPGFGPTAERLLQNQADIGDAIRPFYGDAAGDQLTTLLREHITIAVELLQAAESGDTTAFNDAKARWEVNADQIADLLSSVNPRHWPQEAMRAAMRMHLDQTLAEAAHELAGAYQASIADYEEVHHHILGMADLLSSGIIKQFPARFM